MNREIMKNLIELIPAEYALKHKILPLRLMDGELVLATSNLQIEEIKGELEFSLEKKIKFEHWDQDKVLAEIYRLYQIEDNKYSEKALSNFEVVENSQIIQTEDSDINEPDYSIIQIVNDIISQAIRKNASDIHFESYEGVFRVRYRIDGKLVEYQSLPTHKKQAIISRLKIMASLDIAEKRKPQDGRIRMKNGSNTVDIRVSTMPTVFGEKVVLRILDRSKRQLLLKNLGFDDDFLEKFKSILILPYGMILVTGPTGSGKTTTLYAALNYLNKPDVNIITVEDPIEYNLKGVNQSAVNPQIGLTFSKMIRTLLRQDPDVIMIGEVRDSETAEIAIRAALTGHLVLSTLHTNDAASTIVRLIDMDIEPFLVASALKIVIAQRLVRKICSHCKEIDNSASRHLPQLELYLNKLNWNLDMNKTLLFRGKGCARCNFTGFWGREAVIEYIILEEDFEDLIIARTSQKEIRKLARKKGFPTLLNQALKKAFSGITTIEEAIKQVAVF